MLKAKLLGATAGAEFLAVEEVFQSWLYTGNGSTQTINNGIDLAGEGGLVWIKGRSGATDHQLFDTLRGATKELISNSTAAETTDTDTLTAFNANGFSLGADATTNTNAATYASWTFRKAPRFFDVVTYTGNGTSQNISHNLESSPGCIIVKALSTTNNWVVYHRSIQYGISYRLILNSNLRTIQESGAFTGVSSTAFSVGSAATVNSSGVTYVAYLFAHNAGGFGDDGNQNVVTCSNYTGNGSATGPTVNLGYEPQWLLIRRDDDVDGSNWYFFDNMRGVATGGIDNWFTQGSGAETSGVADYVDFTSTGFQIRNSSSEINANNDNYIYIAIRRGPMREPTVGTQVYSAGVVQNNTGRTLTNPLGYPSDMAFTQGSAGGDWVVVSRLTGSGTGFTSGGLSFNQTYAESTFYGYGFDNNTNFEADGIVAPGAYGWNFRRAPGFFDVVAYTGTGANPRSVTHNLKAPPELLILKSRQNARTWRVSVPAVTGTTQALILNSTTGAFSSTEFPALPTETTFTIDSDTNINANGENYIAYLFASLPGISKVGSYTGNGSSQTINCAFTTGARFILIKRTSGTGDWYVWDTARGIVSGNDPHLSLNTTAAEVTSNDTIDPDNSGFIVNQDAATNVNVNAATYIFFAVS